MKKQDGSSAFSGSNNIYVGNGIWDWMKPAEPITFKVEDLYESWGPVFWDILDALLEDRVDLHDRIKRYKESGVA